MTTNVVSVHEATSFSEIVDVFFSQNVTSAPVVDSEMNLKGLLTHYDLLYRLFPAPEKFYEDPNYFKYKNLRTSKVELNKLTATDIMNKNVVTVSPSDNIMKVCSLMVINRLRRIPVELNSRLLGVVYSKQLSRSMLLSD